LEAHQPVMKDIYVCGRFEIQEAGSGTITQTIGVPSEVPPMSAEKKANLEKLKEQLGLSSAAESE
jgi:hypothetical protein